MQREVLAIWLAILLVVPLTGSLSFTEESRSNLNDLQFIEIGQTTEVPNQAPIWWDNSLEWWEYTALDSDRNRIHDSLQTASSRVNIGLSYSRDVLDSDRATLQELGFDIHQELPLVDAILLGDVDPADVWILAEIDGVVMVERYGLVEFYGDVQTPAVKARNSTEYPVGAWDLGVSGNGMNIALVDTGVDNEHPGLAGKFVAGYDAVCYLHTDPTCVFTNPGRETDGSFDPDDGNQHGTACMGMAAANGLEADGSQSDFYGSAPNATLVDVRIGTDIGAGPFENYLLEQQFYESAMNGLNWVIDNKDTAWPGVDESLHGVDIISLSWGITSHENGGSDGTDMHSRVLDEAMLAGVAVSNAAGNDGPSNDGLSGMSSSSLSITVASTDDKNTVDRSDDTIADYSSRGPRRDNGDGNPVNELIPEISAPGTNIIQAEGCVTSGGCSNLIGDASENTYTGRGSGTSYAAPAVTGVVALVWEMNENLTPLQIKEVLKHTSERRGQASAPDVDPYWNRDFGYGMVDALEAVQLAEFLAQSGQTESIEPTLQSHSLNFTQNGGTVANFTGHAWGQEGSIDRVEYRIDGGEWREATYAVVPGEVGALTPFLWHVILDPSALPKGQHIIEVHAVAGESHSLPVFATVDGFGDEQSGLAIPPFVFGLVALVAVAWIVSLLVLKYRDLAGLGDLFNSFRNDSEIDDVVEAELLD